MGFVSVADCQQRTQDEPERATEGSDTAQEQWTTFNNVSLESLSYKFMNMIISVVSEFLIE